MSSETKAPWEMTAEQQSALEQALANKRLPPKTLRGGWYDGGVPVDSPLPIIAVKWLGEHVARMPNKAHGSDAGYDLYISREATIPIQGMTDLHTDIAIAIPHGFFGRITGRSSTLRKRGLLVNEGIIDNGYRGELFVAVFNLSGQEVTLKAGERVAQLLIHRVELMDWVEMADLPPSERGEAGFGSTGE